jgi:hypothetical protein
MGNICGGGIKVAGGGDQGNTEQNDVKGSLQTFI